MIRRLLLLVLLLATPEVFAQSVYYPLRQGNLWEMTNSQRVLALGDTVLYGGRHYTVLLNTYYNSRTFERVSGDTVYSGAADTERVRFRFDVRAGDTLSLRWIDSVHWNGTVVQAIDTPTVFGRTLRRWHFLSGGNYPIDLGVESWVIDSLGVMAEATAWSSFTVSGAVIDGVTYGTVTSSVQGLPGLPATFGLCQNYPNPFNPSTTIPFRLPQRSWVTLIVYNTLGQKVRDLLNDELQAGYHEVRFNASDLSSGVYMYRLSAGDNVQARKLVVLR